MLVPSLQFVAFAVIAALIFNVARPSWRAIVNVLVNLAFLSTFSLDPVAFAPFAAFLAVGYGAVRLMQSGQRGLFWPLVALVIGVFCLLKKYSFVPADLLISYPYVAVGLSYIFFRVLHLVIDGHAGELPKRLTPIDYLEYVLDFTCVVSGPIQLYQDYRDCRENLTIVSVGTAIERVAIGFFKVFIVSALFDFWHKEAITSLLSNGDALHQVVSGVGVVGLYPIFLFMNFSGYTDVVVGIGLLFQRRLPENFDHPFVSQNFIEFWSRWHMSLSNWLKRYVFNPILIALMRREISPRLQPFLPVLAYFPTFFLVGAWHGQTSEFLFFGVLQGAGVSLNKLYQVGMTARLGSRGFRALCRDPFYGAACRGLTFAWFAFTLLWFWSSWKDISTFAAALGGFGSALTLLALTLIAGGVLGGLITSRSWISSSRPLEAVLRSRYFRTAAATAMVSIVAAFVLIMNNPAPDIVYKAF